MRRDVAARLLERSRVLWGVGFMLAFALADGTTSQARPPHEERDPEASRRVLVLAQEYSDEAIRELALALDDARRCARTIERLGTWQLSSLLQHDDLASRLIALATGEDPALRRAAIVSLGRANPPTIASVDAIVRGLADDDASVRKAAVRAMRPQWAMTATSRLLEAMGSPDNDVRAMVAGALSEADSTPAVRASLATLRADRDPTVWKSAVRASVCLEVRSGTLDESLSTFLRGDRVTAWRRRANEAIASQERRRIVETAEPFVHALGQAALPELKRMLSAADPQVVRLAAARVADDSLLDPAARADVLQSLLLHADANVRQHAAGGLLELDRSRYADVLRALGDAPGVAAMVLMHVGMPPSAESAVRALLEQPDGFLRGAAVNRLAVDGTHESAPAIAVLLTDDASAPGHWAGGPFRSRSGAILAALARLAPSEYEDSFRRHVGQGERAEPERPLFDAAAGWFGLARCGDREARRRLFESQWPARTRLLTFVVAPDVVRRLDRERLDLTKLSRWTVGRALPVIRKAVGVPVHTEALTEAQLAIPLGWLINSSYGAHMLREGLTESDRRSPHGVLHHLARLVPGDRGRVIITPEAVRVVRVSTYVRYWREMGKRWGSEGKGSK